jgi:uncharacterized protein (DUF849 family)
MRRDVIVTCAVTGAGETTEKSPHVPVTPQQIADACIEAARAGAAIAHAHVRDPETGAPSRDPDLFQEVVERVRASDTDVVLNLTSGMGGDLIVDDDDPSVPGEGSDLANATERLRHIERLTPEICTLDCGTLNFGDGNAVVVQTPNILRAMARRVKELGVKPEMEVFDTGHLWFANAMVDEGLIADPPLYQLCMGIPYGAPGDPGSMMNMVRMLPEGAQWAGFGIGRNQMPMVAQAVLLGGHVRVGLEDNLYLEKGVLATNGQLVEKAVKIIELLGARAVSPDEARGMLNLRKTA